MKNNRDYDISALLKTAGSIVGSIAGGVFFEFVIGAFDNFLTPMLRLCIFSVFLFLVLIVVRLIVSYITTPRIDYTQAKNAIDEVSGRFKLSNGKPLFEVDQENYKIAGAEVREKHSNILYYSLSAKTYLNWIDYLYFVYLKALSEKLGCKLIIGLHFPDHIKECKNLVDGAPGSNPDADPNALAIEYDGICRVFEENAKKILGKATFCRENEFYKSNPKKYAESFRLIYSSFVLFFEKRDFNNKTTDYSIFKRRVSHMESAFPVWMLAEKYKDSRLFVLDNRLSLEIWNYQPLKDVRKRNDIFFVLADSIVDKNGKRINVHNVNNVINMTDSAEVIKEKIEKLPDEEKELIISLIAQDEEVFAHTTLNRGMDSSTQLSEMLQMIISHYNFVKH